MKCHKSITITEDTVKIAQRFALANNQRLIRGGGGGGGGGGGAPPPPPPIYVLKCSITSWISCNQARSALRAPMVPLYWLCLCSRFLFTKQGSLVVTVAHVTIQRFFAGYSLLQRDEGTVGSKIPVWTSREVQQGNQETWFDSWGSNISGSVQNPDQPDW